MTNGLVVMTPSSIAYSGTSASINADGSVVFSACSTLTINGIFTSSYDNYMLALRVTDTYDNDTLSVRLVSGGTITTDSNYTHQYLLATGTTVGSGRSTTTSSFRLTNPGNREGGTTAYFFGPFLSQPTAVRDTGIGALSNATIVDFCGTHSTAGSYDGLWLDPQNGVFTGLLTVFGFNQ